MFSTDRNDQIPAKKKLEWVTPKMTLMEAGDAEGSKNRKYAETYNNSSGLFGAS
jgi:hypothetical protein